MAAKNRLEAAAVKIFIRMLGEDDVISTLDPEGLVWLEGRLTEADETKNLVKLFDCTGYLRVDYSSVRRQRSTPANLFKVDTCVMVIGKVESFAPNPLIKAIKVSPISDSEVGMVMWQMEVEEQQREVYRKRREESRRKYGDPLKQYPLE